MKKFNIDLTVDKPNAINFQWFIWRNEHWEMMNVTLSLTSQLTTRV